jgi:TonB-dependent receptor
MFLPSGISETSETNQSAYVRLDFAFENLPKRVAGNIGLRYVRIERDANGFVLSPSFDRDFAGTGRDLPSNQTAPLTGPGVLEYAQAQVDAGGYVDLDAFYTAPENLWVNEAFWYLSDSERAFATEAAGYDTASSTYDAWLPSLNVKVELTSELIGRFAVSKAIAQPAMSDVQNRITTSARVNVVDGEPADPGNAQQWETAIQSAEVVQWTGTGGNAYLVPMESIQYDVSLEWYFADVGSLTGTLFYKDLSNFFVYGANSQPVTNSETGETRQVEVESRANGEEGKMYGYELAYQQFFDQLPGFWSGFGVQANYTWIEADGVPPFVSATPTSDSSSFAWAPQIDLDGVGLQGQSEHTANFVLMYEKNKLSARLAYNWRSEYLLSYRDGISGFPVWAGEAGVMDASVSYDVTDHITLALQATNVLDTLNETYFILDDNNTQAPKSWFRAERQIIFWGSYDLLMMHNGAGGVR